MEEEMETRVIEFSRDTDQFSGARLPKGYLRAHESWFRVEAQGLDLFEGSP